MIVNTSFRSRRMRPACGVAGRRAWTDGLLALALSAALVGCGSGGDTPGAAGGDSTPPSQPANISATTDGPFGINLSWPAATDNVGVSAYGLERCQGSGCTAFAAVASTATTGFVDAGLLAATNYRYRVRAVDAAGNVGSYSPIAEATTANTPVVPPVSLPSWVSALSPAQWFEIPGTAMSSVEPTPRPTGNTGPASKVVAWTSFVADTRNSMVYSVANGGHGDYSGNEVDRLELETETPIWTERLAPTPNAQLVQSATHYGDGRPTSRHSYYGVTLNAANDRIMILGGSRYGNGFGIGTMDSYNLSANSYSAAGTHPNIPSAVTGLLSFATSVDPQTGDIYSFGNFASVRWTRATNSWAATGASGPDPYGYEAMSAMDTVRNRILILGGNAADRHVYDLAGNAFSQVTLTGADAATVTGSRQGALVYVEAIDRFLLRLRDSGGTVYQIHPSSFAVSVFASAGSAAVPATSNGPYNKFLYLPRLRGVVYVPSYSGNAWFLRVH